MTGKPDRPSLTRPAEDTIIKHIITNPKFAHALRLEADALKLDEPDVAARLNHWHGKALYLAEKKTTFTRFDVADYLRSQEEMDDFLETCSEEAPGDDSLIKMALDDIARTTSRLNGKQ
ncbi:hypothetical protein YA0871_11730 [Pseudomonas paralactis]|uniref:Uncharacterized protein n=1 Tax=Pseudomonas paralactis TaxID=1615673 RepID=A0ABS0V068_9PSED|nr:hypothetical protein [Pseudomonas paralactis]MBI6633336.1 hypothetical protein [Pseudomonas paralactis]